MCLKYYLNVRLHVPLILWDISNNMLQGSLWIRNYSLAWSAWMWNLAFVAVIFDQDGLMVSLLFTYLQHLRPDIYLPYRYPSVFLQFVFWIIYFFKKFQNSFLFSVSFRDWENYKNECMNKETARTNGTLSNSGTNFRNGLIEYVPLEMLVIK